MNGIINILKPPMMTSNSVVAAVKKYSGQSHVGHTGTLDPNASGVLPVCIGKATKLAEYFLADEKEYIGEILFGIETDSCDTEGNIIQRSDFIPSPDEIKSVLKSFCGDILQYPPAFSAVRINGKKAYELARNNVDVDMPARNVFVRSIEILSFTSHDRVVVKVRCSKGTYIRSLARDIGRSLNSRACLSMLVRTKCGVFDIADAVTLQDVAEAFSSGHQDEVLLDPNKILTYLPYAEFPLECEKKLLCGNALEIQEALSAEKTGNDSPIRILCKGQLIVIGKLVSDTKGKILIQPTKVIAD